MKTILLLEIKNLLKAQNIFQKENLSFREATIYLDVSQSFLYKMTSKGIISYTKPGGKLIYFKKQDLDNWLSQNPQKGLKVSVSNLFNLKSEL
ncbi:helix-turn-helix domain-containing protein [Maribacter stanieri]|uniref:helix-turn-helix domain-containing protein n=1 Tax=Maribacter stanieri TaxID=440514 RepID=UPI002494D4D2|nr:helix-turn-helix domain-containing protein [Maribacter stanieri]